WPSPDVGGQSRIRRFASGVHSECAPDRKRDKSPSASSLPADTAWDEGRPSARWRENPPPIALRASWPRAEIPHQFPAAHPVTAPTSAPPAPPATAHRGDVFCWSDFHWQLATGNCIQRSDLRQRRQLILPQLGHAASQILNRSKRRQAALPNQSLPRRLAQPARVIQSKTH